MSGAYRYAKPEMKQRLLGSPSPIDARTWFSLAKECFPEIALDEFNDRARIIMICDDLAYSVNDAHMAPADTAFLDRCYGFIRWSVRNTDDEQLKGWIADWFFSRILTLEHSKTGCLEYFDWGDVEAIGVHAVEPIVEDVENFARLSAEWKKRWARGEKLASPVHPANLLPDPRITPRQMLP